MPQQSIDMIKNAEEKASRIRTAALDNAKASLQKAEAEIAAWKDDQLKSIRLDAKKMVHTAEENAESKAKKADAEYEAERQAFHGHVLANMEKAVGIIVERIVKI